MSAKNTRYEEPPDVHRGIPTKASRREGSTLPDTKDAVENITQLNSQTEGWHQSHSSADCILLRIRHKISP